ncbi:MAG: YdcF family protein [Propioniciclava sp.]|uniref:YdcF family protein n=1 Tax=Propioniciclava sp. TaxID=2038686 RepID=UPI0039E4ADD8
MQPIDVILAVGLLLLAGGVAGFWRDRRRLWPLAVILAGGFVSGVALLILANDDGRFGGLPLLVLAAGLVLPVLGYPVLTFFLIANGVTMVRRESRSLGNLLSLLTGLAMLAWPLVPVLVHALDLPPQITNAVDGLIALLGGLGVYAGLCFLVFLSAAVAYRRIPGGFPVGHVIVLGSGLIGDRVPPLLASRLDAGIAAADAQHPPAVIIPTGGKGSDEKLPEGVAMARYLREHGVDDARIVVEDRARNTRENLQFSRALMPDPEAPVAVVTNSYHVFRTALLTRALGMRKARVVGAKTAAYFVPSAFIREFVAVMKENWKLHLPLVTLWVVLAVALTALDYVA